MKITICASMTFSQHIAQVASQLERMGHQVYLPEPLEGPTAGFDGQEAARRKIRHDLIRRHWEKIKESEAILVLNYEKDGVPNYVGGNSFLEMGFAHVLSKKIYLLHDVPDMSYRSEMLAMRPVILGGDLDRL